MIGIFDSGVGGISVLNSFQTKLPQYKYIYLADTKNIPYGNKSENEIYRLTKASVSFLLNKGAFLVIVACNTVSAKVLRKLQDEYFTKNFPNKKVLGIIIPNTENIIDIKKDSFNLGIIGTRHTIKSNKYVNEIKSRRKDINIFSKSCPNLASIIEKDKFKKSELLANIKKEIACFDNKKIDYLLLACTHYSFIKNEIKMFLKKNVKIIDSSAVVVKKTKTYLKKHNDLKIKKEALTLIYTTGNLKIFKNKIKKLLSKDLNRKVRILEISVFPNN